MVELLFGGIFLIYYVVFHKFIAVTLKHSFWAFALLNETCVLCSITTSQAQNLTIYFVSDQSAYLNKESYFYKCSLTSPLMIKKEFLTYFFLIIRWMQISIAIISYLNINFTQLKIISLFIDSASFDLRIFYTKK